MMIYCDGACKGNPGPGGWGVVIIEDNLVTHQFCGSDLNTTNNRMELTAAIRALEFVAYGSTLTLYSDSKYVIEGMTNWIHSWTQTNFKQGTLANLDLWKQLYKLSKDHIITWKWVKGHNGDQYNELADHLATQSILTI